MGLINLLEQLTELRKPIYSLNYWFIAKDIKDADQQPDEEIYRVKSQIKESGAQHGACGGILVFQPRSSPLVFLWRLYYIYVIDKLIGYWRLL